MLGVGHINTFVHTYIYTKIYLNVTESSWEDPEGMFCADCVT